jgi:hypothetical protein
MTSPQEHRHGFTGAAPLTGRNGPVLYLHRAGQEQHKPLMIMGRLVEQSHAAHGRPQAPAPQGAEMAC